MKNSDISQIVARMSQQQRRAVSSFFPRADKGGLWCHVYRDMGKLRASLEDLGLIRKTGKATKLGKAVHNHIRKQEAG